MANGHPDPSFKGKGQQTIDLAHIPDVIVPEDLFEMTLCPGALLRRRDRLLAKLSQYRSIAKSIVDESHRSFRGIGIRLSVAPDRSLTYLRWRRTTGPDKRRIELDDPSVVEELIYWPRSLHAHLFAIEEKRIKVNYCISILRYDADRLTKLIQHLDMVRKSAPKK